MMKRAWNSIKSLVFGNTRTPAVKGVTDYGSTESSSEPTQECEMFNITDIPKPPSDESFLRAEFMETVESMRVDSRFDVPHKYLTLSPEDVLRCVDNYAKQYRRSNKGVSTKTLKVKNHKAEGFVRIRMIETSS